MDSGKRKYSGETVVRSKRIHLDQTADSNLEIAEATKPEYSFHDLPLELIGRIFSYTPGHYWPRLEMVDHYFQSGILGAWRNLKNVHLKQFLDKESTYADGAVHCRHMLHSLLRTLYVRSPAMESISGFFAVVKTVDRGSLRQLSRFKTLKSICFARCHINARFLANFLAESSSRSCLEELRICEPLGFTAKGGISLQESNDRAMHEAVIDKPGRPSLKLKKLVFRENEGKWHEFFAALDVSVLESLSVTAHQFSMDYLAKLLGRCVQLQEFRWSVSKYDDSEYTSLDAFGSLASTKLRKLELYLYYLSRVNEGTVISMLKRIAPVCQRLDTLIIGCGLERGPGTLINVLCEKFPALETLQLDVGLFDAASLTQLVTRLDRMKRLAFHHQSGSGTPYDQVNSDVLKAISLHMKGLESLCLRGLLVPEDSGRILSELEHLKELSVTGPNIPTAAVIGWCKTLGPQLDVLELSSRTISDSSIAICAKNLSRVRRLSLRDTRITDWSLRALTKCARLERLDLSRCNDITESGVQAVIDGCKMLVQLKLYETPIEKTDLMYDQRTNALNVIFQ